MLDTMTRGNSSKKMEATTLPMATAAEVKAQPSERASAIQAAAITAARARASMGLGTKPCAEAHVDPCQPAEGEKGGDPSESAREHRHPFVERPVGLQAEVRGAEEEAEEHQGHPGVQAEGHQQAQE